MIFQKISADEKSICDKCFHHGICMYEDNQPCFECTQFADAAPVVHGHWCWEGEFKACSKCGSYVEFTETLGASFWKFCPYCGVKMDGDGNG